MGAGMPSALLGALVVAAVPAAVGSAAASSAAPAAQPGEGPAEEHPGGAAEAEEALADCRRELAECRGGEQACRSQLLAVGRADCPRRELPEWPEGYGKLLRFPFGISDMKALKQFARALWQPDGTAASLPDGCTDRGFHHRRGTRCVSEMVGVHPVGGEGHRWSAQLWADAQDWCLAHDNCTGIMLYVGAHAMNCHYWCGRPQFCDGPIVGDEGTESSGEWNLFARGGPDGACGEDGASEGASDVGRLPEAAGEQ